jgi:glutamate formiminotransferase
MSKIISVVPNISEGNDQKFISSLVEKLQAIKDLVLLDTSRDSVRNRTVFSFTGPKEAIFAGGLSLYRETLAHVDMRRHRGEYPRLGAVDVFPFVPLKDASIEETVALSEAFAQKVAEEFNIPVYLYGESARFPMRRHVENIREGDMKGWSKN